MYIKGFFERSLLTTGTNYSYYGERKLDSLGREVRFMFLMSFGSTYVENRAVSTTSLEREEGLSDSLL